MSAASEGAPPRVSIGMPVFNGMQYLERAIRSLLAQSFGDFELIIVDNASTDGSYEFACGFRGDERVSVHRNAENIGPLGNFMRCRDLARGEYFMWAAADDAWEPAFVERMVAELDRHPGAGVAMSATRHIWEGRDRLVETRFQGSRDPTRMGFLRLSLALASAEKYNVFICGLFRTALLRSLSFPFGGHERIPLTELALARRFRYVDEVLYIRQRHKRPYWERHGITLPEALPRMTEAQVDILFVRTLLAALMASQIAPAWRKGFAPVIAAKFWITRAGPRLRARLARALAR